MTSKISDPSLLQCSRVDVLDVRPVLEKGKEPLESIQYSLSLLEDEDALLVVAPFNPEPLKKYIETEGFSHFYDEISPRMHWLSIYTGEVDHEVEIAGPGPSYVLPAGPSNHVAFLDCREMDDQQESEWINSTLQGLGSGDLLVVHSSSWNDKLNGNLNRGTLTKKSIISDHVRVEITVDD